jgi:hypothetical protein
MLISKFPVSLFPRLRSSEAVAAGALQFAVRIVTATAVTGAALSATGAALSATGAALIEAVVARRVGTSGSGEMY